MKASPLAFPAWIARGTNGAPEIESNLVRRLAAESGIAISGISDAAAMPELEDFLIQHLQHGHLAGFDWYDDERARVASDPRNLHKTVKSVVAVGLPFYEPDIEPPDDDVPRGRIARYAWGRDYHRTLKSRMKAFLKVLEEKVGRCIEARLLVDTARTVDRVWAARAGIGWYGKHSCVIVPGAGSWVMLGEMFLDLELQSDPPMDKSCGSCRICLDHCPTGAIVSPYTIDAPRCISFQTIEQRGAIPFDIRARMGNWVFGCDVCQDVCPYTQAARPANDSAFAPQMMENAFPPLTWLLEMSEDEFREVYRSTAVLRAKRAGLARNAAIALGNHGDRAFVPQLDVVLRSHDEPLARSHAAWSLARLGGKQAVSSLESANAQEVDLDVLAEIQRALEFA